MVETRSSCEETMGEQAVRKSRNPSRDGRSSCHVSLVQPFVRDALKRWLTYWTLIPLLSTWLFLSEVHFRNAHPPPILFSVTGLPQVQANPAPCRRFRARADPSLNRIRPSLAPSDTLQGANQQHSPLMLRARTLVPSTFHRPIQQSTSLIHTGLY